MKLWQQPVKRRPRPEAGAPAPNHRRPSRVLTPSRRRRGHGETFERAELIGAGLATAGLVGAFVVVPSRRNLLEVVNKHNRLSPQPLQLQVGYDPIQRLASAGAALSF